MLEASKHSQHKKADASRMLSYLACTRQFWHNEPKFTAVVRTKLQQWIAIDKWEEAAVFYQQLFPDDA